MAKSYRLTSVEPRWWLKMEGRMNDETRLRPLRDL